MTLRLLFGVLALVSSSHACVTTSGAYASYADPTMPVTFADAVNALYQSLGLLDDARIATCADVDNDGDIDFLDFVNVLYLQLGVRDVPPHLSAPAPSPPPGTDPCAEGAKCVQRYMRGFTDVSCDDFFTHFPESPRRILCKYPLNAFDTNADGMWDLTNAQACPSYCDGNYATDIAAELKEPLTGIYWKDPLNPFDGDFTADQLYNDALLGPPIEGGGPVTLEILQIFHSFHMEINVPADLAKPVDLQTARAWALRMNDQWSAGAGGDTFVVT